MRRNTLIALHFMFILTYIMLTAAPVSAQIGSTSAMTDRYGTFYTFSARSIGATNSYMYQNLRFFSGSAIRNSGTATTTEQIKDLNYVMGLNFGFSKEFDIIINGNFYQTANRAPSIADREISSFIKTAFVPDDFYLNFRFIPFSFSKNKLNMGFMLSTKFEGQGIANSPFQNYSAGTTEIGLSLLTSYFKSPKNIDDGFAIHLNLQYYNNMDKGSYTGFAIEDSIRRSLADTAISKFNSASLRYALGFSYPILLAGRYLYIVTDVYGVNYLTKPPETAYSRQNYAYVALGVKYNMFSWMGFHVGGEFQLMKTSEVTLSNRDLKIEDLTVSGSDFPKYRIFAGFSFPLSPRAITISTESDIVTEKDREVIKRREVEDILYSEQEIQRRSVNYKPVAEMRKIYKSSVGSYIEVLLPMDKKPVETITTDDAGGE
jgi:hypothetical protein